MTQAFEFVGGDPSLDLVNTRFHLEQAGGADDLLDSGEAARRWFVQAGLLEEREVAQLDPETLLLGTLRLRSALNALYRPLARQQTLETAPESAAQQRGLATLNAVLGLGRERLEIGRQAGGFVRRSHFEVLGPDDPNVRLARRAAELLHRLEPRRLKECERPGCDLLFYDETHNRSRRWCSMGGCGNQQKQARHRRKATDGHPASTHDE
ncbi:CGNR zinc finger domain-containing protein [Deinococcus sp.]|uniref:CGNR zinc finger domain-containing protein n=1 Tax=Deinococcus sp. TaxID=47478 RepID=UPI003CC671CA